MDDIFAGLAEKDSEKKWCLRVISLFSLFFVPITITIFVILGVIEWFFSKSLLLWLYGVVFGARSRLKLTFHEELPSYSVLGEFLDKFHR